MKKIFLLVILALPLLAEAGIIVTRSGENIEDVTNIVVGESEVTYVQNGQQASLPITAVMAVLYDNGNYQEITVHEVSSIEIGQPTTTGDNFENSQYVQQTFGDPNYYNAKFNEDYREFYKNHKDEIKAVSAAVRVCAYRQKGSIFNFNGAMELDHQAMSEYISAIDRGMSGEEAIRARNSVYLNRAEEIKAEKASKR